MAKRKRVLLVDDEEIVLTGLTRKVPWDQLALELAATAASGQEALGCIERFRIDIVVTDILMPDMDGLELIAAASRLERRPRFIILSGHGEFEFAQRAMAYGVHHYVLKPTRIQEVIDALREVSAEIERTGEAVDLDPAEADLLRDGVVRALIAGGEAQTEPERRAIERLTAGVSGGFTVVVVDLGEPPTPRRTRAVRIVAGRALGERRVIGCCDSSAYVTLLVATDQDDAAAEQIRDVASAFGELAVELRKLATPRRVVAWSAGHDPADIPGVHAAMLASVVGDFYAAIEDVRQFTGAEAIRRAPVDEPLRRAITDLARDAGLGEKAATEIDVERVIEMATRISADPDELTASVADALADTIRTIGGPDSRELLAAVETLREDRSVGEFRGTLRRVVGVLSELARRYKLSPRVRAVAAITEAVRQRYAEQGLSLKRLAATEVFANVDYLGRVFRQTTGVGFTDYLLEVRMGEAARLLRLLPQASIREIAQRVGFGGNSQYFSGVFRRRFGVSPTDFRRREDAPHPTDERRGGAVAGLASDPDDRR